MNCVAPVSPAELARIKAGARNLDLTFLKPLFIEEAVRKLGHMNPEVGHFLESDNEDEIAVIEALDSYLIHIIGSQMDSFALVSQAYRRCTV